MIDVKNELKKYKPITMGYTIKYDDDISNLLHSFNKTVERIGKDQYRSLKHMDVLLEVVEEKGTLEKFVEDQDSKIRSMEEMEKGFLQVIMEFCDLTENIYIYSLKSQDAKLINQMELQMKILQQSLLKCGITRFGNRGDI